MAESRVGSVPGAQSPPPAKRPSGFGFNEAELVSPVRPPRVSRTTVFGNPAHKRVLADKGPGESPKKARVEPTDVDDEADGGRSSPFSASPVTPLRRLRRTRIASGDSDDDADYHPGPADSGGEDDDDGVDAPLATPRAARKAASPARASPSPAASCPTPARGGAPLSLDDLPPMSAADRAFARERLAGCAGVPGGAGGSNTGVAQVGGEDAWKSKNGWTRDVRDAAGRSVTDPDYDKTTLFVPPRAFAGLTPFQKQFWEIKRQAYDVVIFFKKGKFYEMYDKDADVVHKELGLNYTGGGRVDMRCCGVPEQAFDRHTSRLLDLGYKVGRVEQTETINAATKRRKGAGAGSSAANRSAICERSLVRVLTRATVCDDYLLKDHRARYLLSIVEGDEAPAPAPGRDDNAAPATDEGEVLIGVCYVDAAAGAITVGEFVDDYRRAGVEKLLAYLRPPEILVDGSRPASERLSGLLRWAGDAEGTDVVRVSGGFSVMSPARLHQYLGGAAAGSSAEGQRQQLHRFFADRGHVLAARAMGACADYLAALKVDAEVLSMGNFTLLPSPRDELPGSDVSSASDACSGSTPGGSLLALRRPMEGGYDPAVEPRVHMVLDAASLLNLEVLECGADRSEGGALISFVDRAVSSGGKRLLRRWLAEPLLDPAAINDRFNAIDYLHAADDASGTLLSELRAQLSQLPDLTRALAKTHAAATVADNAVMFDDTNKRRVKEFTTLLSGLRSALDILDSVSLDIASRRDSTDADAAPRRLEWLVTSGAGVPDGAAARLSWFFDGAFDYAAARKDGTLFLRPGAVQSYDARKQAVADVEARLNQELAKHKSALREPGLKFFHRPKEPYQIEVPAACVQRSNLPRSWVLKSQSKTAQRYWTPEVERLAGEHIDAAELLELETKTALRSLLGRFDDDAATWSAVARAVAELDVLLALAVVSRSDGTGPMCRPKVVPAAQSGADGDAAPMLHARSLRHPVLASRMNNNFVANDVFLGGADAGASGQAYPRAVVVTGSNMGGKSTLLRQTCLAAILAQVGCFVPATSCTLTPVDRIFTRLGAHDRITRGQSTFAVEMEETATILSHATPQSLVIVDELGRGTSTHDGYAIAHAVLVDLTRRLRCRTLFATHYHLLTESFAADPAVALYEMAIRVNEETKDITFLYRFSPGVAPASFGIHCARLAGIPATVADHADTSAKEFEETLAHQLAERKVERLAESLARCLRGSGAVPTAVDAICALAEAGAA